MLVTIGKMTDANQRQMLAGDFGLSIHGFEYVFGTLRNAKRVRNVGGERFGHWEVVE